MAEYDQEQLDELRRVNSAYYLADKLASTDFKEILPWITKDNMFSKLNRKQIDSCENLFKAYTNIANSQRNLHNFEAARAGKMDEITEDAFSITQKYSTLESILSMIAAKLTLNLSEGGFARMGTNTSRYINVNQERKKALFGLRKSKDDSDE